VVPEKGCDPRRRRSSERKMRLKEVRGAISMSWLRSELDGREKSIFQQTNRNTMLTRLSFRNQYTTEEGVTTKDFGFKCVKMSESITNASICTEEANTLYRIIFVYST
jgi:hypothetical protein